VVISILIRHNMSRPSIRTVLLTIFVTLGLTVSALSAYTVNSLGRIELNMVELAEHWLESVQMSDAIDLTVSDLKVVYRDRLLSASEQESARTMSEAGIVRERLYQGVKAYRARNVTETEIAALDEIERHA